MNFLSLCQAFRSCSVYQQICFCIFKYPTLTIVSTLDQRYIHSCLQPGLGQVIFLGICDLFYRTLSSSDGRCWRMTKGRYYGVAQSPSRRIRSILLFVTPRCFCIPQPAPGEAAVLGGAGSCLGIELYPDSTARKPEPLQGLCPLPAGRSRCQGRR